MPLFAQEQAGTSNTDGLVGLAAVLFIAVVFYLIQRTLKRKAQQAGSSKRENPAAWLLRKAFTAATSTVSPKESLQSKLDLPPPAGKSAKSIFISYRRQDSQHITGRIYDRLSTQFGKSAVFKDVDSMPLGVDFREHIREQVGRCSVLVAVIGKNWNAPSASGNRRLNDRGDHLRIEIEAALERRIPVIPVLVDGVEMPSEEELPPSMARLAYHHGISVRPDPDFHNDADRLVRGIETLLT